MLSPGDRRGTEEGARIRRRMCGEGMLGEGMLKGREGLGRMKLIANHCWKWQKRAGKLLKRSALPLGSERTPEMLSEHLVGSPPTKL